MPESPIPEELLAAPEGPPPALPPETALLELPFGGLTWENFEKLCLHLADAEAEAEETRRYGTPGQDQSGIDIFSRLRDGAGYCVYQCKRYEALYPGDIRAAVARFLEGPWAERAGRLVFCTSHSCVATERADVIEEQAALLRARDPSVTFEAWDAERLALKLKPRPDLVRNFFGPDALRRFDPSAYQAEQGTRVEGILEQFAATTVGAPRIVDLSWGRPKLRDAYGQLSANGRAQIHSVLGENPSAETIAGVIAHPSSTLVAAGGDEWRVLALEAERTGQWVLAAQAWSQVADRADSDDSRVKALGDGAAAAGVGGDTMLQADLQQRARDIDASHPRVTLMDLDEGMEPAEQLDLLEGVSSDDPGIEALIESHRVLAHLRLADVASAEKGLEAARKLAPDSATVEMLRINLAVQRGRLDLVAHRALRGAELREAIAAAKDVRWRLQDERRYSEAVRVLMLAADAHLLLEDREGAARVLGTASAEELSEPDAPEVLGDAALRAFDSRLALRLIGDAGGSEALARIRAEANLEVGDAAQKQAAIDSLNELVAGAGREAAHAAFLRLYAALGSAHVAWSEEARDYLVSAGYGREATVLEAGHLARDRHDLAAAKALLEAHDNEPWALVWLMRLALTYREGNHAIEQAADRVMALGPSQAVRLECGLAFARTRNFARAREVLVGVARDPGAPARARADAYDTLVRVAGREQGDWERAGEYLSEWIDLAPADTRASQWAPTVANRRRHG